jgi:mRNA interferase HigB
MLLVGTDKLEKFKKKHAGSRTPLNRWVEVVRAANWGNFSDIKKTFNSVDKVGELFVFNIKGNDFRLIVEVIFRGNTVIIK